MNRSRGMRVLLLSTLLLLLVIGGCAAPRAADTPAPSPPNIILIFIDDMGYGDLSVFGNSRIRTEHIDRLAEEGIRFTQFYVNSPICSPSRVAITTGTYPTRWRINSYLDSREKNRARGMPDYLDPRAPTLPRMLQQAGYATAHFGKWHMGGGRDVDDAPLPQEYGFDETVTSFEGLGKRYLWRDGLNEQSARLGRGEIHWAEKHEMTRIYVDHAIDFIRRNQGGPFYINLWPNDVHDEHWPEPGSAEKYTTVARSHYERDFFAVLEEMDRQLGRLFEEIKRLGLDERTIVLLTSDNGATDWPHYYREGFDPPGSSGPFRGRKWSLYEGGIRMPLIVRWPGRTPAGLVDNESLFTAMDLVPSLARMAGATPPAGVRLDGEDVSAALLGTPSRRQQPIYWFYLNDIRPGNPEFVTPRLAVREGKWKLLVEDDGSGAQLYDLETDPTESRNLAREHTARVAALTEKVLAWRRGMP